MTTCWPSCAGIRGPSAMCPPAPTSMACARCAGSEGEAMFKTMSFKKRMAVLPVLAGLGFLTMFAFAAVMARRTKTLINEIETSYFASVEMGHDLRSTLTATQRMLQDAVAAKMPEKLAEADTLAALFATRVRQGTTNPRRQGIAVAFESYYRAARPTSARMIAGHQDEQLTKDLTEMVRRYNAVRSLLRADMIGNRHDMADALHSTIRMNQENLAVIAATTAILLALLIIVAVYVTRQLVYPLAHAVRVAEHLARGEVSVDVAVDSDDEVGQLLASVQQTTAYLQEMADAADAMAAGDLTVHIQPRSEADR